MEKRICYEPWRYREHMYQRVYCTQNKIGRMKKKMRYMGYFCCIKEIPTYQRMFVLKLPNIFSGFLPKKKIMHDFNFLYH